MKSTFKRKCFSDKVFIIVDYVILVLLLLLVAYPLLYVIMASFSAGANSMTPYLIPKKFSMVGYQAVFSYRDIWTGYLNSIINMVLGTFFSLALTLLLAYPLSRKDFKARGPIMVLCMITMYFAGGMIPTYITVRNIGLLNTRWALLLPGAVSVYNMIVIRSYLMTSIPGDIWESAQIDGCGNVRYLISMVIPLSKPILAVTGLFCAVGLWNGYFDAMIYVSAKRELYPLALILREILVLDSTNMDQLDVSALLALEERRNVMKYAVIVVSSLPVMAIYPFVQKFFVKGVMIGSVKG